MAIRVLLVDDSAVIRGLLNRALSADSEIEIIGSAAEGEMGIAMATKDQPDIIILDIEMPVMDGITALPHLRKAAPNSKIIISSTLSLRNAEISMKALSLGASDYLAKPSSREMGQNDFYREMIAKIKALAPQKQPVPLAKTAQSAVPAPSVPSPKIELRPSREPMTSVGIKALAIASSTGGPQALTALFAQLSGRLQQVPIFITQHMPPTFTAILAGHIAKEGNRIAVEATNGMMAEAGKVYVAPGDYHMVAEKDGMQVVLKTNQDPQENYCRPAADPMLRSLSKIYGKHLLVVVLTGMGQDGLEGAKIVVENGGYVIAQDEASCVVYGMPKAVVENKLCTAVLPLSEIARFLTQNIEGRG